MSSTRWAALGAVTIAITTGACTDRTGEGLPDLSEIDPAVLAIDLTVTVGPTGCAPSDLEIPPRTTVGLTAHTDGVRVRSGDDVFDTGEMLEGETVEWYLSDERSTALTCTVDDEPASTGTLTVSVDAAQPSTTTTPNPRPLAD